jgi:hypothetical protein
MRLIFFLSLIAYRIIVALTNCYLYEIRGDASASAPNCCNLFHEEMEICNKNLSSVNIFLD